MGYWRIPTEQIHFCMKFFSGMLKSLCLSPLSFGICWRKMFIMIFFIIFIQGGVEMAACRWTQEGIPLFRHNMMWLRVSAPHCLLHASAGHVSCCLPLICFYLSALFPWFYLPSPAFTLTPSSFLEIVDDRRWSQLESWLYLLRARSISNTPPHLPAHSGWLKTHRLNPVESIADKNANWQSLSSSPPFALLAFVPLFLAQLCREWQL